ncbi:hypothetical protein BH11VER1_BH11VER1_05650 [soil metagenome]
MFHHNDCFNFVLIPLFNDTSHYDQTGLAIPEVPSSRLSKWWAEPEHNRRK